jgi:hypothetical protein
MSSSTWASSPLHEYRPGWNPDGFYNPNGGIFIGDVPPQPLQPEVWYWDPQRGYVYGRKPLTAGSTTTMISTVKERIEFTESYDTDSSSIAKVWWNANTERLTVRFRHGGLYSYDDVSNDIFQELMDSESIGKHFAKVFKGTGPAGQEVWPGAKHDENNVLFVQVEKDAERLISFVIHHEETTKGQTTVQAKDVAEAIAKFAESQGADHPLKVTGVFIPVE